MAYRRSIQHRLMLYVSIGLLILTLLSGIAIYRSAFNKEIASAESIERLLVATVQTQAEVAVFANNADIAQNIIEGLRATPRILTVKVAGGNGQSINVGASRTEVDGEASTSEYPLYSPVDGKQHIGVLVVTRNDALIRTDATINALHQTMLMVVQIFVTALLIILFSHYLIGRPINELVDQFAAIKPGSGGRVSIAAKHHHDEIGSLAQSANALIQSAEDALEEVRALATQDVLTGLPNRRAFMVQIEDEHARIKRYELPAASVLMLDIDFFKRINDQYGHAGGDAVLRHFGALLAGVLRKVDFAGRIGGEEFAVLLPATDLSAAGIFAERIRTQTEQAVILHEGTQLCMTISIGIATLDYSSSHFDTVLASADKALYQAKRDGRNRAVVQRGADEPDKLADNAVVSTATPLGDVS